MNRVYRSDGTSEVLPVLLTRTVTLCKGDLFHHVMAGGGGYGDPLERNPEFVLNDVVEERVTRAHAAAAYGVVIADGQGACVNQTATAALRARLRDARSSARQA
jgi:N-methylhydantoinase B